jgi:hypothetical protein
MEYPTSESDYGSLRVDFDHRLRLEGARVKINRRGAVLLLVVGYGSSCLVTKVATAAPRVLADVKGVLVVQDDDSRVHWTSGAAVDADGSNGQNGKRFAYRADDQGLDAFANAGWPNGSWRDVLIDNGDGKPKDDGNGNCYSQTTYAWKGRPINTRYVDATSVPYVVVNPIVRSRAAGVVIGCRARVTYKGASIDAVVADVSGPRDIGEISINAAQLLGIPDSPRNGGVSQGVLFEIWPGTAASLQGENYELQPA